MCDANLGECPLLAENEFNMLNRAQASNITSTCPWVKSTNSKPHRYGDT